MIVTMGGLPPNDAVAMGDSLAEYLDQGGKLITFSWGYVGTWSYTGRLASGGYFPLTAASNDNIGRTFDGASTHFVFNGLTDITGLSMNVLVTSGATVIANYNDILATPLAAEKGSYLLFNTPYSSTSGTDKDAMVLNGVDYLLRTRVLVLHASEASEAASIGTVLLSSGYRADIFDYYSISPSASLLRGYRLVVTHGGIPPSDPVASGDALADYVDEGGKLIMFAYSYVSIWSITGRLRTSGYMPLTADNNDNLGSIYDGASTHKLFKNVNSLSTSTMYVNVSSGANVLAYNVNGVPLVAVRQNVLSVNSYWSSMSTDRSILLTAAADLMLASDVLILQSGENGYAEIQTNLLTAGISVDMIDNTRFTPRLTTLVDYDVVITMGNFGPVNQTLLGDNLADYHDQGGKIITFAFGYVTTWTISGRLLTGGYMPLTAANNDNIGRTYDGLSTHEIFNGVTSVTTFSMNTVAGSGATVFANHIDGEPLAAIKGNYIVFNTYYSSTAGGDKSLLLLNAVDFLGDFLPDTLSPTFESFPIDNTYEEGSTGNVIGWTLRDENPSSYSLKKDGLVLDSSLWSDGDTITTSVDGLAVGIYVFEMVADDVSGNSAVHSVTITISDTVAPIFSLIPTDFTYIEGETGNIVQWTASDSHPASFDIYVDEVQLDGGIWISSNTISLPVDGLSLGTHNVTLKLTDLSGNTITNTVFVTVEAPITTTVTSSETTKSSETTTTSETTKSSETSTTRSEITKSSENGSDTSSSDAPELPIPFSNIYVIIFSLLGFAFIVRKRK
ncbi:MAG: hypothetical protein GPJ54_12490 [Candidatus Heimdallarchaeota archaeon]|nr:hypothetical protein [Candidatus Heimdallarchaeota archaeon]